MSKATCNHPLLAPQEYQDVGVASEDDRVWFEQHPGAKERIRPPFSSEGGGSGVAILVVQVAPGFRVRMPVVLSGGPTP